MAERNRLHRSELAVPGSNTRMLEKAPTAGADMVFLDLEDAVAPDDKAQARKNVIEALNDLDWSNCSVSVRINGLDTHYCYRDIVDVVEQAGDKLDTILIPKVGTPADILFVSTMLEQIEAAKKLKPINLHILIETALGPLGVAHNGNLTNADAIKRDLFREDRRHINTNSDSEILLNVLAHELQIQNKLRLEAEDLFQAVSGLHRRCSGGYAAVALIPGYGILGFVDDYLKVVKRRPKGMIGRVKLVGQVGFSLALAGEVSEAVDRVERGVRFAPEPEIGHVADLDRLLEDGGS